MNKYRNIRTEYNGVIFDSRREACRAAALEMMQRIGVISGLERQKAFELQPGFTDNTGAKIRPIHYIADFVYFDKERGKYVVEDVKSAATRKDKVYTLKKKIFLYKYSEYVFLET